jgi:branched-chain amino acid aminotransferase
MKITKRPTSKIEDVDFNNLNFGAVFTDHMFQCDFKDGAWQEPEIVPYGPMQIEPGAKVFHYGQAVFEGMKAFKDDNGKTWLFRPEDNWERINKSSSRLAIPEFPKEHFFEDGNSMYIRPFVIATENGVSASPASSYRFMIILAPAQSYYSGEVSVIFAQKYSRAADGGVGYAKAAGNYAAQFYPTNLAKEKGYQQIIWTDASTHQYLEEAGTMNVFFRIGDTLVTAPTNDRILDGITRKSIIKLAKDAGIAMEVRPVAVSEIVEASQNGELKEIFGTGTAAVVVPFKSFGHNGKDYTLPLQDDSFAERCKTTLKDIQYNRSIDTYKWTYEVK